MVVTHNFGFPRLGQRREMKKAVEAYWRDEIDHEVLQQKGATLRAAHWELQKNAGIDWLPVGDFSWYDHILEMSALLGVISPRFLQNNITPNQDTLFAMARGCEITKWFDTNYHYVVPEFHYQQTQEATNLGYQVKPTILGPISFLWLGKTKGQLFDKLSLLPALLTCYEQVIARFEKLLIEWIQIDEPVLAYDLPNDTQLSFSYLWGCR